MASSLDQTFAALADPTRRAIIARLVMGEATVNEVAAPFDVSLPAISRHLKVLEQASLIIRSRDGQHRRCRLNAAALREATEYLEFYRRFWSDGFDRLAAHLRRQRKPRARR
ncbi:MAG: helix-turn-helix transcriptional regulator [Alphaproteobacteria bacterium]|nr:helix-turn-helix transcriptional regulator [Alphaproteobacteria bacterium]